MSGTSKSSKDFLPYGRQWIDADDIEAVVGVLNSDFLTTGPKVVEFENSLKAALGVKHVIACSSATAALHMTMVALGVGEGDVVIVPSMTFVASANAVRMCGGTVVFADVNPDNGLMEATHFEAAIKKAEAPVKAVIPVHLTGQCGDMKAIASIAKSHNIKIVSDACHALGGTYKNDLGEGAVGNCAFEEMSCFSFHPVKTIAMGEGGAVATNNDDYARIVRSIVSHGAWQPGDEVVNKQLAFDAEGQINPWYHEFHRLGWNYRASDIHCALGWSQMKKLPEFISKRRALAERYKENLHDLVDFAKPIAENPNCASAWHLFSILIDFDKIEMDRAALMHHLKDHNIGTQVHYIPVHLQPTFAQDAGDLKLIGAETYYSKTLSFPLFPHMQLADVDYVVTNLKSLLE